MASVGFPSIPTFPTFHYGAPDFSWIGKLPAMYEAGQEVGRENALRDEISKLDPKDPNYIKNAAAVLMKYKPQAGLTTAIANERTAQNGVYGTPIWGKDANGNEGIGAIGRDGTFHLIDTGTFQPQRGVTIEDLGYGKGVVSKGGGEVRSVIPQTGDLPSGYVPPPNYAPFGPNGGVAPATQAGELPVYSSPQTGPYAGVPGVAPLPSSVSPPPSGSYMPGTEAASKAELTKQESELQPKARDNLSDSLGELALVYRGLDKSGGIVNPDKPIGQNIAPAIGNTAIGQAVTGRLATKEGVLRNRIKALRPGLINYVRQAAHMGAKSLDSNVELSFYLQQATDPSLDIYTNYAAIDALDKAYGRGDALGKLPPSVQEKIAQRRAALASEAPKNEDEQASEPPSGPVDWQSYFGNQ